MLILFYYREKLCDYRNHDYNGGNTAPFSDSEAVLGDCVHRYWFSSVIIEREIHAGLFKRNEKIKYSGMSPNVVTADIF